MKIVLLAGASSIHTIRWANGLDSAGHDVHVITQHPACDPFNEGVQVHYFPYRGVLGYFTMVPGVKKLLRQIQPDIVNAHYASGYATTARLVDYHPWMLSVWGSDVYDFPYISFLHCYLVRKNLLAADHVASTSHCMAEQTRSLVPELTDISITPFGVDMQAYQPVEPISNGENSSLMIGTVKTMADKYGIDTLIQAFNLLRERLGKTHPLLAEQLRLRLVGGGPKTGSLKELVNELGLQAVVAFTGRVPHQQVPDELAKLDIYVALSRLDSESFGVAIIEAGAVGLPVVVSDAGGLPEVVLNNKTGLVVPRENPEAAADALEKLVLEPTLRHNMGVAGRKHVEENYSWPACITAMEKAYQYTLRSVGA